MPLSNARRWAIEMDDMPSEDFDRCIDDWRSGKVDIDDPAYKEIRKTLREEFVKAGGLSLSSGKMYSVDIEVGLCLYVELEREGFTEAEACNDDIWRYLTIKVFPDLTYFRYPAPDKAAEEKGGRINQKRFFSHTRRIWLKTLWWYIHLSWQGSVYATRKVIEGNGSDIISQFIERPGKGYRIDLYRTLMRMYSARSDKKDDLFKRLAKLSRAECKNMEPALLRGGAEEYCQMLFKVIDESDS